MNTHERFKEYSGEKCWQAHISDLNREADLELSGLTAQKISRLKVSDFEFEFQMATMNHHLNSEVSTLLMVTSEKFIHLNSSVVKDVARLKGDISNFVTPVVMQKLKDKFDLI